MTELPDPHPTPAAGAAAPGPDTPVYMGLPDAHFLLPRFWVALALSRGEASVPVLYVDLAPEEEALVLATLDPIGAMAGRDDEKLRTLLAEVTVDDAGLAALFDMITAGNRAMIKMSENSRHLAQLLIEKR